MKIIIHRGSNQIGGSCIEVFTENTRIVLDIGQELPNFDNEIQKKVSFLPKVSGLYKWDEKTIDGILISHGHGDHVGLINSVNPKIPVYIGEMAFKIMDITARFTGEQTSTNPMNYLRSGEQFSIEDFKIIPYLVDHSGFDSYAFLIKANNKSLVYTGDFRDHGRKVKATDYFIDMIPEAVDGLLIEGTMMSRMNENIRTEEEIESEAYNIMNSISGPAFVLQSSTNIDRLVGMYKAAKRSNRIFVMDIFTAHIVSQLNPSIPNPHTFKDVRVFYPFHLTKKMFEKPEGAKLMKQFSNKRISRKELGERKDYCMLIRANMVSDLQHIENLDEASFIYSMWSGYKEDRKTKSMLDYISLMGMTMIDLHTSGHASMECIEKVIVGSQPDKIIPIHTENPKLFADKFKNVHIANDGDIITL